MPSADVLTLARSLLARGIVQGALATDAAGVSVPPADPAAARWCARGAVLAAEARFVGEFDPRTLAAALAEAVGTTDLDGWADDPERTAPQLLAAFARAIALAEAVRGKEAAGLAPRPLRYLETIQLYFPAVRSAALDGVYAFSSDATRLVSRTGPAVVLARPPSRDADAAGLAAWLAAAYPGIEVRVQPRGTAN